MLGIDRSIPNTPAQQCLVRISEHNDSKYYDVSDSSFTIEPSVTITSPTDGQNLGSAQTITLNWDTNFTSDTFNIEYSIDFGSTCRPKVNTVFNIKCVRSEISVPI